MTESNHICRRLYKSHEGALLAANDEKVFEIGKHSIIGVLKRKFPNTLNIEKIEFTAPVVFERLDIDKSYQVGIEISAKYNE